MTATATTSDNINSELIWLALGLNLGGFVAMAPWGVEMLGLTLTVSGAQGVELIIRVVGYFAMVLSALRLSVIGIYTLTRFKIGEDTKVEGSE